MHNIRAFGEMQAIAPHAPESWPELRHRPGMHVMSDGIPFAAADNDPGLNDLRTDEAGLLVGLIKRRIRACSASNSCRDCRLNMALPSVAGGGTCGCTPTLARMPNAVPQSWWTLCTAMIVGVGALSSGRGGIRMAPLLRKGNGWGERTPAPTKPFAVGERTTWPWTPPATCCFTNSPTR